MARVNIDGKYWKEERERIHASKGDFATMDAWYRSIPLLPCPCCGNKAVYQNGWIFCTGCSIRACGTDVFDDWQNREKKPIKEGQK